MPLFGYVGLELFAKTRATWGFFTKEGLSCASLLVRVFAAGLCIIRLYEGAKGLERGQQ